MTVTHMSSVRFVPPLLHRLRAMSPSGSWWSRMGRRLTGSGRSPSSPSAKAPWQQLLSAAGWTLDEIDRRVISIAITGCAEGQGVSTLAMQTAASAASVNGAKSLLIDCNLYRPSVPTRFHVTSEPGLCEALGNPDCLPEAIRSTCVGQLFVLPPGSNRTPIDRGGEEFAGLIRSLRAEFDLLVLDMPPVSGRAEVHSWCHHVDAVMLMVAANTTAAETAKRTAEMLREQGVRISGVVMNYMPPSFSGRFPKPTPE